MGPSVIIVAYVLSHLYVNPYIRTQTPEEDLSDHMQSPGWRPDVWSGDLEV